MTDIKEKLVELLNQIIDSGFKQSSHLYESIEQLNTFEIADHLIANGVTVKEWIPVTERLPEPFVSVLVLVPSEAPLPTVHESYIADHEAWVCILTAKRYKSGEVTHWMPMPEPPKEGN